MRILDEESDRASSRITVFLKRGEAEELRDTLESILSQGTRSHAHAMSDDHVKVITIALYDESKLDEFNERSITLIKFDR